MSARAPLQPGWLIASRPYSDSSLLLEVFTREQGRIGLVARGARGPKSRLRGVLQIFTPLLLSWTGRGELATLTAAEAQAPPVLLTGERIFYGWYVNELLGRLLLRHDAHIALFDLYAALLPALVGDEIEAQGALRLFEKYLLAEIGYGLRLPTSLDPQLRYRYDWESGPQPDREGYAGASLIALRDDRLDAAGALADARRLLQAALRRQLGDRPLETPRLLRSLRGLDAGASDA